MQISAGAIDLNKLGKVSTSCISKLMQMTSIISKQHYAYKVKWHMHYAQGLPDCKPEFAQNRWITSMCPSWLFFNSLQNERPLNPTGFPVKGNLYSYSKINHVGGDGLTHV